MLETKKIKYGDRTLELPAGMTLEEAKAQMARFFPELAEPKIETKKDGDDTTYVFSKQAGRKGSASFPGAGDKCRTCGEIMWSASHKCAPRWEFCLDGDGDDWRDVYASTALQAAEKAAQKVWDSEYGDRIILWVRLPGEMVATQYPVDIEAQPVFTAVSDYSFRKNQRPTRQLTEAAAESES